MSQFKSLIVVSPLGFMYASAGGFLSPENLVGRANAKFPPDSATVSGLLLNANREQNLIEPEILKKTLVVAGPFWAEKDQPSRFYVPIPRHRIIDVDDDDEWILSQNKLGKDSEERTWYLNQCHWQREDSSIKSAYSWQQIESWDNVPTESLREAKAVASSPWEYAPFLHPKIKEDERHVVENGGLFLENTAQLPDNICLVYLTNMEHDELTSLDGWYRFSGEGHLVELGFHKLSPSHKINKLLERQIGYAFALITPGVWGSNQFSHRYPQHPSFPSKDLKLLTEKAIPYRYRIGPKKAEEDAEEDVDSTLYNPKATGRLSRGRYAVPSGSVYVFSQPLRMTWWEFPNEWFPKEGFSLKHLGCGLCLPIDIQGVPECTEKLTA